WIRDGGLRTHHSGHDELLCAWLDEFAARHVTAIGLGAVRLRISPQVGSTRQPSSSIRTETVTEPMPLHGLGDLLQHTAVPGFALAHLRDADVLDAHWITAETVTELRRHQPGDEAPTSISLHVDAPFERSVLADTLLAAAVGACDGELRLRQIAD